MHHPTHHARSAPGRAAYIMGRTGETVSYRMLEQRSNQGAQLFRKLGLVRGDQVALMLENVPGVFDVCFAAQRSGLFYTSMSTRLSLSEAEYVVNDCNAKVLIVSAGLSAVARDLRARVAGVKHFYVLGGSIPDFQSWETAIGSMPDTPIADQSAGRDMLYSSGTTGRPKGVKVELAAEAFDAPTPLLLSTGALYGFDSETRYLSPAPLYHAAPLRFCMTVLRHGGTVVAMEKFDPETALSLIQKYKITHSQWVPSMFVRMLKLPVEARAKYDVGSLKVAIHAAAPCPVPIKEQMIDWWGPVLHEYYAGTEGNGFVACNSQEWLAHKGTVGKAFTGVIKIVDLHGNLLPAGPENAGTIYFEGGAAFEYHNDPEKTASSRNAHGWSTLGDIGYLDDEGFLYLTDRKSHMIISGGVNIYPQEVEDLLITHPKVADAAVIGVPNEEFGEEVKAVVQPLVWTDATPALADELIAYCRANISHVKCPRSVDFDPELPRHPTGKLYKRLIRDRYWKGRTNKLV